MDATSPLILDKELRDRINLELIYLDDKDDQRYQVGARSIA